MRHNRQRGKAKKRGRVAHLYPNHDSMVTRVANDDRKRFATLPGVSMFIRPYIPGEFHGVTLPEGKTLDDVEFVLVRRLNAHQHMRIALTREEAKKFSGEQIAWG